LIIPKGMDYCGNPVQNIHHHHRKTIRCQIIPNHPSIFFGCGTTFVRTDGDVCPSGGTDIQGSNSNGKASFTLQRSEIKYRWVVDGVVIILYSECVCVSMDGGMSVCRAVIQSTHSYLLFIYLVEPKRTPHKRNQRIYPQTEDETELDEPWVVHDVGSGDSTAAHSTVPTVPAGSSDW
jgi:hypothetical protein